MADQATRDAAADLIDNAMDLLREHGWCKNHLQDVQGRMCLAGALRTADGQDLWRDCKGDSPVFSLAFRAVARQAGRGPALASFNDHPDTTLEDVLLVGKKAAHSLREVT